VSNRVRILSLALITSLAVLAPTTGAAGATRTLGATPRWGYSPLAAGGRASARQPSSLGAFSGPLGFGSALIGSAPAGNGPSTVAVNPATDTIYVANGNNLSGAPVGGDTVSVIDSRHCNAQDVSRCKGPWPTITVASLPSTIAVDPVTDTVYVAAFVDNSGGPGAVSVFNGATCNALDSAGCGQNPATVPVGVGPIGIFADHRNHTVYVANTDYPVGNTVSMIDSATCNAHDLDACPTTEPPTVTIPPLLAGFPGSAPDDVDVDQATHTAYVAIIGGVAAFDANTCNATVQTGCGTIGTMTGDPNGAFSAKVDPANHTVYTTNYDSTISVFDLRHCTAANLAGCAATAVGTVTLPQPGFETNIWVAVDPANHSVYVVYQKDDALVVVNTNICNGTHLAACATLNPHEIHTGTDPEFVALDPQTQTLYTANQLDNDVSVIDASRCNAQTTTGCRPQAPEVPIQAGALAADPAVHTTYAASGPAAVSMIDTKDCNAYYGAGCLATPPTVTVGTNPSAIAIDRRTQTVYVANFGSQTAPGPGTVSVVADRTCNAQRPGGCAATSTLHVPGGNPVRIAVNSVTDTIYVATITDSGPNLVSVFNGATCNAGDTSGCNQTPASLQVGDSGGSFNDSSMSIAVNKATNTIYVTNLTFPPNPQPYIGDTVYVINGATCDANSTTGCGQTPTTVTLGSDALGIAANPVEVAVDQATNTIYTANLANGEGPGTSSVINGATCNGTDTTGCGQTPATARAGFGADGVAIDQATNQVYVTNIEDTSVTTIDGASCNGTTTGGCEHTRTQATVGDYPGAITVDPAVGTAYVADALGVSVFPLTP
jgi:DNA-binding beta-propeller fold protein YncE